MPFIAIPLSLSLLITLYIFGAAFFRWRSARRMPTLLIAFFGFGATVAVVLAFAPGVFIHDRVMIGWLLTFIVPVVFPPVALPVFSIVRTIPAFRFLSFPAYIIFIAALDMVLVLLGVVFFAPARVWEFDAFTHWVIGNRWVSLLHGIALFIPGFIIWLLSLRVFSNKNNAALLRYRSALLGAGYFFGSLASLSYFALPVFEIREVIIMSAFLLGVFTPLCMAGFAATLLLRIEGEKQNQGAIQ